jgi:hypothetical protein
MRRGEDEKKEGFPRVENPSVKKRKIPFIY